MEMVSKGGLSKAVVRFLFNVHGYASSLAKCLDLLS